VLAAPEKEKDSEAPTINKIKNPIKISRFKNMQQQRTAARTAYLFLEKIPVSTIQIEKKPDITAAYTRLYSSSAIDKLGPHIVFSQNV
jgi:hypothetical protein